MSTAPKAEVLNLSEMVGYQTGSVVSRQITLVDYAPGAVVSRALAKSKAGTLTLFAFDAGEELSEHTAPFDALVHVLEGGAEILISGESFSLEAGDAIIMPADEPHAVRAVGPFKMLLTMIRK
jgi:quercetin dioxygenase-like cupin family protein